MPFTVFTWKFSLSSFTSLKDEHTKKPHNYRMRRESVPNSNILTLRFIFKSNGSFLKWFVAGGGVVRRKRTVKGWWEEGTLRQSRSRNDRVAADERCQLIFKQIRQGPVSALRSEGFGVPLLKATVTHKAGLLEQLPQDACSQKCAGDFFSF